MLFESSVEVSLHVVVAMSQWRVYDSRMSKNVYYVKLLNAND
jgi:hypothetical protein